MAFRALPFSKAATPPRRSLEEFYNQPRKAGGFPHGGRHSRGFELYIASFNGPVANEATRYRVVVLTSSHYDDAA